MRAAPSNSPERFARGQLGLLLLLRGCSTPATRVPAISSTGEDVDRRRRCQPGLRGIHLQRLKTDAWMDGFSEQFALRSSILFSSITGVVIKHEEWISWTNRWASSWGTTPAGPAACSDMLQTSSSRSCNSGRISRINGLIIIDQYMVVDESKG